MRLWSLHPNLLDAKGLVALWREALLAAHVLSGQTKGYKHHPQLARFKEQSAPSSALAAYLNEVYKESKARGYSFDRAKIKNRFGNSKIKVTRGQVQYELKHLLGKLKKRDKKRYDEVRKLRRIRVNPVFSVVPGPVESWEKTK